MIPAADTHSSIAAVYQGGGLCYWSYWSLVILRQTKMAKTFDFFSFKSLLIAKFILMQVLTIDKLHESFCC